MRSGQQNKRGRGRNNSGRKNGNPLTRTYDSTGPDVKIRGTAQHIADKYGSMARDALGAGDSIMAENYLQHAEHYNRIIASAQAQMQERYQREERDAAVREQQTSESGDAASADGEAPVTAANREPNGAAADGTGPQPVVSGTPPELAIDEDDAQQAPRRQPSRRRSVIRPRRTRATTATETAPDMPAADDAASEAPESRSSSGDTQDTAPEVAAAPEA